MPEVILPCPTNGCAGIGKIYHSPDQLYVTMLCVTCGLSTGYVINPEEAIARWNKLPRAPRWTHEPPKVAGWYFQRTTGEDKTINIAYVYSGLAGLYCKCGCRNTPLKCWIGFEWAGPISPPID